MQADARPGGEAAAAVWPRLEPGAGLGVQAEDFVPAIGVEVSARDAVPGPPGARGRDKPAVEPADRLQPLAGARVVDEQIAAAIAVQVEGDRLAGHAPLTSHGRDISTAATRAEPLAGLRLDEEQVVPSVGVEVGEPYASHAGVTVRPTVCRFRIGDVAAAGSGSGSGCDHEDLRRWRWGGGGRSDDRCGFLWKSCEPGRGIAEVDPGASHVRITDDLLGGTHGLADGGPPALKDLPIQLEVHERLPGGAGQPRRCPHSHRTAIGRPDERFGETLFREQTLEQAVEAVQRDDDGQLAAVGQPGHVIGREQVQSP